MYKEAAVLKNACIVSRHRGQFSSIPDLKVCATKLGILLGNNYGTGYNTFLDKIMGEIVYTCIELLDQFYFSG